jgi:ankyrin repeat protein
MPVDAIGGAIFVLLIIVALVADQYFARKRHESSTSGAERIHQAVMNKDAVEVRNLLAASPELACDPEVMLWAILKRQDDILAMLLELGANVRQELEWGGAALHIAARYGTLKSVQAILARGADLNEDRGGTPLYWAADQGRPEMVELLLQHGADSRSVAIDKIGKSSFKPTETGQEGFESIRQRVARAQILASQIPLVHAQS